MHKYAGMSISSRQKICIAAYVNDNFFHIQRRRHELSGTFTNENVHTVSTAVLCRFYFGVQFTLYIVTFVARPTNDPSVFCKRQNVNIYPDSRHERFK